MQAHKSASFHHLVSFQNPSLISVYFHLFHPGPYEYICFASEALINVNPNGTHGNSLGRMKINIRLDVSETTTIYQCSPFQIMSLINSAVRCICVSLFR